MKKIFTLLLLAFATAHSNAQETAIVGNSFQFTGKIISDIHLPAYCGVVAFAMIVEFDVVEDPANKIAGESIGVVFTCPRERGEDFYEKGATYRVTVADKNQASFGWAMQNKEALDKYNLPYTLYVIEAEKVE